MNEEKIQEFAKKEGYSRIVYEGVWKGYDTYYADYFGDDKIRYVGLPFYVLVKENEIRLSKPEECLDILEYFNPYIMLKFKYKDTVCTIDDKYNMECSDSEVKMLEETWKNILALSLPSKPCPIDQMYEFIKDNGAEIIEYTPEYDPDLVY